MALISERGLYPSAEVLSVYSTTATDKTENKTVERNKKKERIAKRKSEGDI